MRLRFDGIEAFGFFEGIFRLTEFSFQLAVAEQNPNITIIIFLVQNL